MKRDFPSWSAFTMLDQQHDSFLVFSHVTNDGTAAVFTRRNPGFVGDPDFDQLSIAVNGDGLMVLSCADGASLVEVGDGTRESSEQVAALGVVTREAISTILAKNTSKPMREFAMEWLAMQAVRAFSRFDAERKFHNDAQRLAAALGLWSKSEGVEA
ncbi:hypothetical protein M2323_000926 [Rhodoblastus acidophilus]|uniref:hypothetical protein n=1 Tax=Rhodoblastus acidophilus TaxID=1074 RepID=UPI002225B5E1|nr:hypothetical protein [Rhodoblastus acidophilus]MCW2283156.1 hypothetical protein [Rhodoblastus acidophilus]MCW2332017.1 hypothetical protein [Rhodoblastus acidophilus]